MTRDAKIADLVEVAAELEGAPLDVLIEYEDDIVAAYESLGRAYNRWLMKDWK